ncbi:MAG: sigma-70 family RNA polymerase sigma factor [Lachnospiraceae bacterium]|nr:sigma-70 family RNA polymerase sigma factor [Lachnospiraceae bacterium]
MNTELDLKLLRASREGDSAAVDEMLNKYRGMVIKESRKFYLFGADNEDLIQEGMIALHKAISSYKEELGIDFPVYATRCIRNQLNDAWRADRREKNAVLNNAVSIDPSLEKDREERNNDSLLNYIASSDVSPEAWVIGQEGADMIWKYIRQHLSKYERTVLEEYLGGKKCEEIAIELGKEKKSIENAINRIRTKLAKAIGKY